LLWPPCVADADIIFLPCGFFYLLSFFFSSPNLIRRRLDVCHTFTHGVALVRILDAGLKRAARCTRLAPNTGRKKVAKNRHQGTIAQLCRAISSQLRHLSTIGKKLLSSNMSSSCPPQYGELRPTIAAEIDPVVWGTQLISTAFASWQCYCTAVK